jgi:hypothetical protein
MMKRDAVSRYGLNDDGCPHSSGRLRVRDKPAGPFAFPAVLFFAFSNEHPQ